MQPSAPPGHWTIHCDGSAVPNPGRMGLGASILAPDGTHHSLSRPAPEIGCNNEAELSALIAALEAAQRAGADAQARLLVFSDSRVVVDQLAIARHGKPAARPIARLAVLFDTARALIAQFHSVDLRWIPQHRNEQADALARAALGITAARVARRPRGRRAGPRG